MTAASWVALAVAAVAALADWWAVHRDDHRTELVAKPIATAALVAVALLLDPQHDGQRAWFVAALVLSLAGDVFLVLPGDRFVPGLASFLLAHLAYVAGFVAGEDLDAGLLALGAAAVVAVLAVVGRRVLRHVADPALRAPVAVYMAVIGVMGAVATGTGEVLAVAGAWLFLVSDATLAEDRFVARRRHGHLAVMVTYHLAQAALATSLVR